MILLIYDLFTRNLIYLGIGAIVADLDFGTSNRRNLFSMFTLSWFNAFLNKNFSALIFNINKISSSQFAYLRWVYEVIQVCQLYNTTKS